MNSNRCMNKALLASVLPVVLAMVVFGIQPVLAGPTVTVYKSPT